MHTNIYVLKLPELGDQPLVIFAGSIDAAIKIHQDWLQAHPISKHFDPNSLKPAAEGWSEQHPKLLEAAEEGFEGTAVWVSEQAVWMLCEPPKVIWPEQRSRSVSCFEIVPDEGDEILVFAASVDHAGQMYGEWHMAAYGREAGEFIASEKPRDWLETKSPQLVREMDRGITGVAGWTLTDGAHIFPPDHAMAGE